MGNKKGQREWLMNYGWSILAGVIVIGILGYLYFDIPSESIKIIDEECIGKKLCESLEMNFSRIQGYYPKVICLNEIDKGIEIELTFKINKTYLSELYVECREPSGMSDLENE